MKRLAELDAGNPNIVRESTNIEECGMMPMPGMGGQHTPASINMSADSGSELTGMLRDIMQLAGVQQAHEPEAMAIDMDPVALTADPIGGMEEPMQSAGDKMRSVLDKLNPEPAGDQGGDLGAFQDGDEEGEEPEFGNDGGEEEPEDDEEEADEGQYDNSPAGAQPTSPFDANEFAHQENHPGGSDRMDGNMPNAKATFENLMKEYKSFIGESSEEEMYETADDEDMEEGIEDRLKDLDPKNPVNIPAYKRKAASGDSASAAKNTKESANESMADILKLSGLTKY